MSTPIYGLEPVPPDADTAVPRVDAQGRVDPLQELRIDLNDPSAAAGWLRTTAAVRERASQLLARARRDESAWFTIGADSALDEAARSVADVTRERYPSGLAPLRGGRRRSAGRTRSPAGRQGLFARACTHSDRPGAGERAA
jgi:hypothetical protein